MKALRVLTGKCSEQFILHFNFMFFSSSHMQAHVLNFKKKNFYFLKIKFSNQGLDLAFSKSEAVFFWSENVYVPRRNLCTYTLSQSCYDVYTLRKTHSVYSIID